MLSVTHAYFVTKQRASVSNAVKTGPPTSTDFFSLWHTRVKDESMVGA